MNFKLILFLCGVIGVLILTAPIIKLVIKGYVYSFLMNYGVYLLIALAGGGYYLWLRVKARARN
jgi:hypothetical protein